MNALDLVPKFLRREPDNMPDSARIIPPPIATLPEFSPHDEDQMIFGRAAVMLEQIKRERQAAQIELAETVLGRQGDQQKIGFLEKENAELRLVIAERDNTIATLQADVLDKDKFMSLVRQVLDKYGIQAPPKKQRKEKPPKQEILSENAAV